MVIELLPNIFDQYDLSIYGNASTIKTQTKFKLSYPICVSKGNTHQVNITWRSRCYNKLDFTKNIKNHLKDQTKKMKKIQNMHHLKAKYYECANRRMIDCWHVWGMASYSILWRWHNRLWIQHNMNMFRKGTR
jgi:hypothetical protein